MTPCFEGFFEIAHVGILLGIDARVGKENREVAVKVSFGNSEVTRREVEGVRYSM
jgi:hypothetical protein